MDLYCEEAKQLPQGKEHSAKTITEEIYSNTY